MQRKTIRAAILIVIILSPIIALAFIDTKLRTTTLATGTSFDVVFATLKDLWYPSDQETQVYPILIVGEAGGCYRSPTLTLPSKIHIDIYAIDVTNNSVDLTWIGAQSLIQIWDGQSVNVSLTPSINGSFGEPSVIYEEGVTRCETWLAQGDPDDINRIIFSSGMPRTNNQFHSLLCSIELEFVLSPEHYYVVWTFLLELVINRSNALVIAGHEINFMISYTYYWSDYLLGFIRTSSNRKLDFYEDPQNLTLGNGETYGQWDCGKIYVLEGILEYLINNS